MFKDNLKKAIVLKMLKVFFLENVVIARHKSFT